ncbi:MAG: dependent ligase-like protein [Burkholderiaceae bacterium]|nr:dependent ligase-like protein [Burkholderiaceae bacterium]
MMRRMLRMVWLCCLMCFMPMTLGATPNLMLANSYHDDIQLSEYWVSEKLDGVRAYWSGTQLISRQGNAFAAPDWFTVDFPQIPLDGELWMGRGTFETLSSAVRRTTPVDSEWRAIRLMVFDMPEQAGDFNQRLEALRSIFAHKHSPYMALVGQEKIPNSKVLMARLDEVVDAGGEGLMLHLGSAPYRGVRSDDLLKLKRFEDAEATVLAHIAGTGKYQGMMGALLVQNSAGVQFKIGTGFSDAQRRNPPPIGSEITYRYRSITNKGVPRFASFMRVRTSF